ncbi:MAG TPA: hypothetical protein VMB26_03650 [Candidatus Binataceae bacterium]|nr:hypothetical protein [Candidatus Binataceae bacterium]
MKKIRNMIVGAFALLMLALPVAASAAPIYYPPPVHGSYGYRVPPAEPYAYRAYPAGYYGHHYFACRDPHFRRHHPWLCW